MSGGDDVRQAIPLTPLQRRFMLTLQRRLAASPDVGVSYEQLQQDLGLSSKSSVARLVAECEARGRISRIPRASRSLRVLLPVSEETGTSHVALLASYSDIELVREISRRGLFSLVLPDNPPTVR